MTTDWQWDQWLDQFALSTEGSEDEYYDDDPRENDCNA